MLTLWECKGALHDALREAPGILALATSSLDTPLRLRRTTHRVVGRGPAGLRASFGPRPGAPDRGTFGGTIGGTGGPVHRCAPGH